RLRLVAAEQQHRAAGRRGRSRREPLDVDGVREDLPRATRLGDEAIRRALAELALVEDVVGREERLPDRAVERLVPVAGPGGVADAVLVQDDRNAPPAGEREQRAEVARQPRRAEVEEREIGRP